MGGHIDRQPIAPVSNRDADIRRPSGARSRSASRPDPDIASLEVAQVLEGVCGHSPPLE